MQAFPLPVFAGWEPPAAASKALVALETVEVG